LGLRLSAKELWVNSGCGGRFQVTRTPQDSGHGNGSNVGYAIAAVAAIAGLVLLANSNRRDDNRGGNTPAAANGPFRSVGVCVWTSMRQMPTTTTSYQCRNVSTTSAAWVV